MRYRVGTYNCRKGRSPRRVAREIRRIMRRGRLDVLNVQEFATMHEAVARLLPAHLDVVGRPYAPVSARDSAVIVNTRRLARKGRTHGKRGQVHRLERVGWERAPENRWRGLHNPRSAVSTRVGTFRSLSLHMPPGPHSWPLRGVAWDRSLVTVERVCRRWNRRGVAWVLFGDWNRHVNDRAVWMMCNRLGATREGSGIDWIMAGPGVRIVRVRRLRVRVGSDHRPKVAVIKVED